MTQPHTSKRSSRSVRRVACCPNRLLMDYDDIPSKGMYLGRSGRFGAAPLVCGACGVSETAASATDKRVFDRISVVEARYGVAAGERTLLTISKSLK